VKGEEAIKLCRGVAKLHRWTGTEVLNRSSFLVPAPIIAYNMFMNGVDRMDQLRSTNITQRREKRLYMTMFTMCLDLAIHQAYCLYNATHPNVNERKHKCLQSFKQQVAIFLVEPLLNKKKARQNIPVPLLSAAPQTARNITETLGRIEETHMLVKNLGKKKYPSKLQDVACYLCKLRGFVSKTIYGCPQCKTGFHVECFTAFHYKGKLHEEHKYYIN
jgi:hypothetical protein